MLICPSCHNSVRVHRVSVTRVQIAHHIVGGRLCSASGSIRNLAY